MNKLVGDDILKKIIDNNKNTYYTKSEIDALLKQSSGLSPINESFEGAILTVNDNGQLEYMYPMKHFIKYGNVVPALSVLCDRIVKNNYNTITTTKYSSTYIINEITNVKKSFKDQINNGMLALVTGFGGEYYDGNNYVHGDAWGILYGFYKNPYNQDEILVAVAPSNTTPDCIHLSDNDKGTIKYNGSLIDGFGICSETNDIFTDCKYELLSSSV